MDEDVFLATIELFGEENVVYIGFDNSGRYVFNGDKPAFSLTENYIPALKSLTQTATDPAGKVVRSVRHLNNLQSMNFVEPGITGTTRQQVSDRFTAW